LDVLIDRFLDGGDDERARLIHAGYARTMACHTYRHRCAELVKVMEGRVRA
jgi:spore maturation protein CgeB